MKRGDEALKSICRVSAASCENRQCHPHRDFGSGSLPGGGERGVGGRPVFYGDALGQMRIADMAATHLSGSKGTCRIGEGAGHGGLHCLINAPIFISTH